MWQIHVEYNTKLEINKINFKSIIYALLRTYEGPEYAIKWENNNIDHDSFSWFVYNAVSVKGNVIMSFLCIKQQIFSMSKVYVCVNFSQLIRYARACLNYQDFMERGKVLTKKLLNQRYKKKNW